MALLVRSLKPTQRENDIISFVTMEEWRDVDPKSGLISPFSLLQVHEAVVYCSR